MKMHKITTNQLYAKLKNILHNAENHPYAFGRVANLRLAREIIAELENREFQTPQWRETVDPAEYRGCDYGND